MDMFLRQQNANSYEIGKAYNMGTRYEGSKQEIHSLNAYIKLLRAVESITSRINGHLRNDSEWISQKYNLKGTLAPGGKKGKTNSNKNFKLTLSQLGVLEALLHLGPLCQSELGKKLLKSSGNITMVVDNLEFWGLVERQSQANDRRYKKVLLTKQGREVIEGFFPRHVSHIVEEMSALTIEEMSQLENICRKLGLQVGKDN